MNIAAYCRVSTVAVSPPTNPTSLTAWKLKKNFSPNTQSEQGTL